MRGSLSLGRILGIPIRLHLSWFLIAALITWSLAAGYFPQTNPGWSTLTYLIVGAVASLLFSRRCYFTSWATLCWLSGKAFR